MRARILLVAGAFGALALGPSTARADSWTLANTPGFGNPDNTTGSMAVFDGHLYVVTRNLKGAEVWKSRLGSGRWREITPPWPAATTRVLALAVFGGRLYLGTDVGEVWRTAGELPLRPCVPAFFRPGCLPGPGLPRIVELWSEVTPTDKNWRVNEISSLAGFDGHLYLTTSRPLEIWRAVDGVAWEPVVVNGFGDPINNDGGTLGAFAGRLYVGSFRDVVGSTGSGDTGLEIWRTENGTDWEPLVASDEAGDMLPGATLSGGFGFPGNAAATALVVFRRQLYVSTVNHADGAQIWRYDGLEWERATPPSDDGDGPIGPGDVTRVQTMTVFRSRLFAARGFLIASEAPVWATFTGTEWGVVNPDGFGEGLNTSADAMVASWPYFFVLTQDVEGVRVWRKAVSLLDVLPFERGRCIAFPALCGGPPPIPTD